MDKKVMRLIKKQIEIENLIESIAKRNNAINEEDEICCDLIKNKSDLEWVEKLHKRAQRIQKQYVRLGFIPCQ